MFAYKYFAHRMVNDRDVLINALFEIEKPLGSALDITVANEDQQYSDELFTGVS